MTLLVMLTINAYSGRNEHDNHTYGNCLMVRLADLLQTEMTRKEFLGLGAVAVATIFGLGGVIKMMQSHAATPSITAEPESGTMSAGAQAVFDTSASGGKAVKFASPALASRNLFFVKSSTPSSKKMFGHYFPQMPRSRDNLNPTALGGTGDYWDNHFLKVSGESNKHATYGGMWRDRPIPRAPIAGDWQLEDMKWEIQTAQQMGFDGFFVNIIGIGSSYTFLTTKKLVDAAVALNNGFKIIPMIDCPGGSGPGTVNDSTATQIAADLAYFWGKPSTYLDNGKLFIGSFGANAKPPQWWTDLFTAITAQSGLRVCFSATINDDNQSNINLYAPVSDYSGTWWTSADPTTLKQLPATGWQRALSPGWAAAAGNGWQGSVHSQIVTPYSDFYDESCNAAGIVASWDKTIRDNATYAQGITWSDFGEGGQLEPSVARGYAPAAINAYHAERWKYGVAPTITTDCVFLSHRDQPLTGATYQSRQTRFLAQRSGEGARTAPRDKIEIRTYLTAPATVTVSINGVAQTPYTAPAGESFQLYDNTLTTGTNRHSVSVARSNVVVAQVTSPFPVTANPVSQDRQYFFASSLHGTAGQYYPLMKL